METHSPNILIVDDEQDMLNVLGTIISNQGCQVSTAHDGFTALEKLHREEFNLILVDYNMPVLNGIDLIQLIFEQAPNSKVVLMTAYDTDKIRNLAKKVKVFDYLAKPFPIGTIKRIVQQVMAETQKAEKVSVPNEAYKKMTDCVQQLRINTQAHAVLLLRMEGHIITVDGDTTSLDISTISTLVAANFMAMFEVAKLLGNQSVFRSSYYEGPTYDVFAYSIDENHLLATILGERSKAGIARLYTKKTADLLQPILHHALQSQGNISTGFSHSVDEELKKLFQAHNKR